MRREAADLSAGGKHAMARHDNRERILPEGLTHRASGTALVEPRGDVAVGERLARRDAARDLVDAAMEGRNIPHIELDLGEIDRLSPQQRDNTIDRASHLGWRQTFCRCRKSMQHPFACLSLSCLRKLE